jgi:predicted phage-related endonuclease
MTAIPLDRSKSIGGSDVAAIMGLSPFRTPLDVWREKVLGQDDFEGSRATRAGERFEPHLLAAYQAKLADGDRMWRPEPTIDGYRRSSPDAMAEIGGWLRIVEGKTTIVGAKWGEDDTDLVPLDYVAQGTWYADMLGAEGIDYPVLIWPLDMRDLLGLTPAEIVAHHDVTLRTLKVPFSPAFAAKCRDAADRFWHENVLGETPPPAVDNEDAKRMLRVVAGRTVDLDEDDVRTLLRRDRWKAAIKKLEQLVEGADFTIRTKLGDAEEGFAGGWPVVRSKLIERSAYSVAATKYRPLTLTKHWKEMQKKP